MVPGNVYVVLLAGGSGTRLWPSSRTKSPKQFIKLFGKHTLFQETVRRVRDLVEPSRILVITNADYSEEIQKQEPLISEENIFGEPMKRNTAMAMGVASAYAYKRNPDAVVINLACDHLIGDEKIYLETLSEAAKIAGENKCLVSIGVTPTFPHTGLGYIKAGAIKQEGSLPVYKVESFKEKPDKATAESFIADGHYYWNVNNYVWHAKTVLDEFSKHAPDIYEQIMRIYNAIGTDEEQAIFDDAYEKVRDAQIDIAIAEKTDNLYLIPGNFAWNDIGDWKVVYDMAEKDENGNHITIHGSEGKNINIDTTNTLIQTEDQMIATIGVDNLIIIDTKDALLICHRNRAQDVKKMVEILKEKNLKQYI